MVENFREMFPKEKLESEAREREREFPSLENFLRLFVCVPSLFFQKRVNGIYKRGKPNGCVFAHLHIAAAW